MPHTRFKSVNMGKSQTGKTGAYALDGATAWTQAPEIRTPTGRGTGIFGARIPLPDGYTGPLLWTSDITEASPQYACEDINPGTDEYTDAPTSGIPAAVWSSASRTLTAFGFAVTVNGQVSIDAASATAAATAVWSSASRTLSDFTFAVALTPTGLDGVAVEPGVNARQALQAIGAATAGRAAGGSSGTPTFYAMGNPTITRITATTNDDGRPAVNLNLN